jgi:hypothetical protein
MIERAEARDQKLSPFFLSFFTNNQSSVEVSIDRLHLNIWSSFHFFVDFAHSLGEIEEINQGARCGEDKAGS